MGGDQLQHCSPDLPRSSSALPRLSGGGRMAPELNDPDDKTANCVLYDRLCTPRGRSTRYTFIAIRLGPFFFCFPIPNSTARRNTKNNTAFVIFSGADCIIRGAREGGGVAWRRLPPVSGYLSLSLISR